MSVFEQLQEAIADTLNIDPDSVTETSSSDSIAAWDSLGQVNLMVALEDTFDVELEVEDFPTLVSVPSILAYLKDQGID